MALLVLVRLKKQIVSEKVKIHLYERSIWHAPDQYKQVLSVSLSGLQQRPFYWSLHYFLHLLSSLVLFRLLSQQQAFQTKLKSWGNYSPLSSENCASPEGCSLCWRTASPSLPWERRQKKNHSDKKALSYLFVSHAPTHAQRDPKIKCIFIYLCIK